jgi:hypothetical protein
MKTQDAAILLRLEKTESDEKAQATALKALQLRPSLA